MDQLSSLDSLGLGRSGSSSSPGNARGAGGGSPFAFGTAPPGGPVQTSPQLVYQSQTTAIYRLFETGFKVVLGPNPPKDAILKLLHEQNVSNFLPWACRRRRVTDVTSFNKRPALSFKWASGITLREWLEKARSGPQAVDLNVRLRAAMAVARTLCDFHDGGVAHNRLSPENVVLSLEEGEYVATLIDLSVAIIFKNGGSGGGDEASAAADPAIERQIRNVDLESLGLLLDQMLREADEATGAPGGGDRNVHGAECAGGDPGGCRRKRGKQQSPGEGLPLYLRSMISALTDLSDSSELRYESARDVFLDLKVMAENPNDCLKRTQPDEMTAGGRLLLPGDMFYGRQVEMSMLSHLCQSCVRLGNQPLMATISGYPGTGKSALVNQIKKPLSDLNGSFIEGKFDKSARPDTVLASALNSFFGKILEGAGPGANTNHMSMKWRVHDAVGSGCGVLLDMIPNLGHFVDGEGGIVPSGNSVKGIGSSHRLKFMLCKLVGAIACRAQPLILFLDDLQWADEMTLDIIRMMMTDPDTCHFLFLGCYRDNEVNISHQLLAKLKALRDQGINIVSIKIGPIGRDCVDTLLSELLCLPPSLCRLLSSVVHSKTGGIILFIMRFLASLNEEGDLWFSMTTCRWMYDIEKIRLKEIQNDVVSHMTEHMKSLSIKMRMGLKVAACLGPNFDVNVLEKATKKDEIEDSFLKSCVEFGFLQNQLDSSNRYAWTHDQIQQAAYDLIPLPKRESFHLLLGSRLFIETPSSDLNHMIFFIVDNMNRGSGLIDDTDYKYEVSQLNLEAGEKALSTSAFHSAVMYLLKGLSLLPPDSWQMNYDLTMRLNDAASEALFITGDFNKLSVLIEEPLRNARSFEDKLNIHNNLVRAFAASSKYEEGISKCLEILFQLGEVIPTKITPHVYEDETAKAKKLLHGKSRQELLSLPVMSDSRKLAAMQFMNHALAMTYIARPLLNPILVFRMVKMSIEHGICDISALAFACYGGWLVSQPEDIEGGHGMGRIALEMTKLLGAVEMTPRLFAIVYGFINIWKEPWQAGQSKHLEAYESGAMMGDVEFSFTNVYQYSSTAIYGCGENLEKLFPILQSYAKKAFQCNHRTIWMSLATLQQLILDLMGIDRNAFLPFANGMTEDTCFASSGNNNEISMCRLICCKKKYVAFFKGDMDSAAEMCERIQQNYPLASTGRLVGTLVGEFIDGLIGLFVARKHREDGSKWVKIGLDAIRTFRKWVRSSDWNFSNKLYLLEAEYYFLKEDDERANICYNASINAARDHRFVHEEGLAEQKFATYLLHKSRHEEAMSHFINAKKCYEVWGAHYLVQRTNKAMGILLPLCSNIC